MLNFYFGKLCELLFLRRKTDEKRVCIEARSTVLVVHPVQIESTEVRNFKDDAIVHESWSLRTRFRVWTIINVRWDIFGSANKIFQLPSYIMLFLSRILFQRGKNLPLIFITKYNESLFPAFSLQSLLTNANAITVIINESSFIKKN